MAGDLKGLFRGQVRTLFDAGTVTGLTDGQLLERFATRRGEASELAFTALVERHGPMVLRACRGVLRDDHEAMDAFQATFLVLARKGGSLWVRDSLGPWLHRVAGPAAGRATRASAQRLATEKKAVEMADHHNVDADADREELASVIHEEVDRLPERYRSAVVLCDLEGRTCEEAARHLGCPVGTVGSRLSRGRDRLRDRLTRRGLATGMLAWQGPREPLPAELVGATVAAATRFVSIQAASQGPAALLALGVLRSMAITSWWKIASLLLVVTASTSGVVSFAGRGAGVEAGKPDDPPQAARVDSGAAVEVKPGKLTVVIKERGSLEASRNNDVMSKIEGQTTIIMLLPEGTRVKKGQLVCELDSASLRDQLTNQRIAVRKAEAALANARLSREVAEIALKEYAEGIYLSERSVINGNILQAKSSVKAAEERLKRTRSARERVGSILAAQGGAKTAGDVTAELDLDDRLAGAEDAVARERLSLEIRQGKLDLLGQFTMPKTTKQLSIEIEKARAGEAARQEDLAFEKDKAEKLERQIVNCKLYAPNDGILVISLRSGPLIEEGAVVREGQKLFSIPDLTSMRVAAWAREAIVDQLKPGQTARIRVDAFPDETFDGAVETVAPRPDRSRYLNSSVKVYATNVTITKGLSDLRPGMTADVEILVAALDDVLSVPVQAVVQYDDKDHVAVKKPDGGVDWREVKLGRSNGHAVEVKEGLKAGEAVVIEPVPLLSEEQKRKVSTPTAPAAGRKR
ncbi:MAG: efflux RND transporter periplasmic adaptor subunit [Paludisphaera borealis]|uniref:efflux RND transporter periplasmic adaptor subunit n=1 Tax=Paludisphaera borealis TaxID=1387353 RepID=UPI0028484D88|nr:efflux RND transporter periplasmic adaptor subunit [Paludisphaera borealis]MDR3623327.1 efflux RND transporter periplasmic adaptor subunit [Paludisphaera borealis]